MSRGQGGAPALMVLFIESSNFPPDKQKATITDGRISHLERVKWVSPCDSSVRTAERLGRKEMHPWVWTSNEGR